MKLFKLTPVYTVRVVYKGGYAQEFDVLNFKVKGNNYSWEAASIKTRPIVLGADEIAAIWQVGVRYSFWRSFFNKAS